MIADHRRRPLGTRGERGNQDDPDRVRRRHAGRARPHCQPRPAGRQHNRHHNLSGELTPKCLELLSELVPRARVIALLVNPNASRTEDMIEDLQVAARSRRVIVDKGTRSFIMLALNEGVAILPR